MSSTTGSERDPDRSGSTGRHDGVKRWLGSCMTGVGEPYQVRESRHNVAALTHDETFCNLESYCS